MKNTLYRLIEVIRSKEFLVLLGILALAAYLRLWNITHLFNAVHDYDEGAWALSARFISEGYLPYHDFMLDHPPLYELVLAAIYKIFGYSFFYGRYLSVALSLVCIFLIYLIGKKMYHPVAGLAAAALFAVSTEIAYFGRRSVQEMLCLFLILVAVYLAIDFINNKKQNRLLFCGLALGLTVAAKYSFIPAVAGIILAIIWVTMEDDLYESIKCLSRPILWVVYLCFAAIFYSILLLFKWVLHIDIAIPFLNPMYLSIGDVLVVLLVFVLPFLIAVVFAGKELPIKKWWLGLWRIRSDKGLWLLVGGTVLGFFLITGFFWVKMPQDFFHQTMLLQQNRPLVEFPSLIGLIRVAPFNPTFSRLILIPVLFAIPLTAFLLSRRNFSKVDCFLVMALATSFILCQLLPNMTRYYVSIFPFLLLGLAGLISNIDYKVLNIKLEAGLLVVMATFLLFLNLSVVLLRNYADYDLLWSRFSSGGEPVYGETLSYLKEVKAEKLYATNPSFPAMSPNLKSTLAFDTFALLWLEKKSPKEIVANLKDENVDYVVVDAWARYWGQPYREDVNKLVTEFVTIVD